MVAKTIDLLPRGGPTFLTTVTRSKNVDTAYDITALHDTKPVRYAPRGIGYHISGLVPFGKDNAPLGIRARHCLTESVYRNLTRRGLQFIIADVN
jgi:hypothetical protein